MNVALVFSSEKWWSKGGKWTPPPVRDWSLCVLSFKWTSGFECHSVNMSMYGVGEGGMMMREGRDNGLYCKWFSIWNKTRFFRPSPFLMHSGQKSPKLDHLLQRTFKKVVYYTVSKNGDFSVILKMIQFWWFCPLCNVTKIANFVHCASNNF